ncbi:MAG: D-alanyl-D-alanine carboxypeptidase, partial [Roseibium sp.]
MRNGAALLLAVSLAACQTAPSTPTTANAVAPQPVPTVAAVAYAPAATAVPRGYSELVIDMVSGAELSSINPDEPRYPASLTKMMT